MKTLNALQEMLELNEAGLKDSFMRGYNDAKSRQSRVKSSLKRTADAEKKTVDDATKAASAAGEQNKQVNMRAVADDVTQFIDDFFTKFPNYGGPGGAEDVLTRYPTKEFRVVASKAFRDVATRVEELRNGFNRSLTGAGLVSAKQMQKFNQQALQMKGANASSPPQPLVRFVKNEARFFKRLVKVDGNSKLNDSDFKELLQLKVKQTNAARVPDAAQALNMLFGYMISEFNAHANVIDQAVDAGDADERKGRIASRT